MSECLWCHRERDLKTSTDRGLDADHFVVAGPDGRCLFVPYGKVCDKCFDSVREQWASEGAVSQPMSAYGGCDV